MSVAVIKKPAVPGLGEQTYSDSELVQVHINLPKVLWKAVEALAKWYGTNKTNVVIRALNKELFFARIFRDDPEAQVVIEHSKAKGGEKELVSFV